MTATRGLQLRVPTWYYIRSNQLHRRGCLMAVPKLKRENWIKQMYIGANGVWRSW